MAGGQGCVLLFIVNCNLPLALISLLLQVILAGALSWAYQREKNWNEDADASVVSLKSVLNVSRPACQATPAAPQLVTATGYLDDMAHTREIFNPLTAAELRATKAWLKNQSAWQLEQDEDAITVVSNYVFQMELLAPPKAAALSYIDGSGAKPDRYARAILYQGGWDEVCRSVYWQVPEVLKHHL
jgi:hypothetical protein